MPPPVNRHIQRSVSFWHRWYNWRAKLASRLCRIRLQLECHNVPSLSFTCTTFHRIWHPAWANSETPASCDAVLPVISDKKSLLQNTEITHAPSECAHFPGSGWSHGAGRHQSSSSAGEADRNYSPWENALVPRQNLPPWGWEAALLGSTTGRQVSVSFCFFLKKKACCVCLLGKDLSSKVLLRLCVFRSSESETERSLVHTLSPWCTGKQCTTIRSSRTSRGNSLCLREQSLTQSGRSVPFFLCLYLCVVFLA